jgi:hypothetical protein
MIFWLDHAFSAAMTVPVDALERFKPQAYTDVRAQVRDGDLLLCSTNHAFAHLIRWSTRSPWSHVAMAFRLTEIDRVIVLECVERIGVRAVPFSSFVAKSPLGHKPYPGHILLARHAGMAAKSRRQPLRRMAEFAFDRLGDRFSQLEMAKIALRIVLGRFDVKLHPSLGPDDEFICSEYVAKAFERVGIHFPWDGRGFIAPSDIAADPRVQPIAQVRT